MASILASFKHTHTHTPLEPLPHQFLKNYVVRRHIRPPVGQGILAAECKGHRTPFSSLSLAVDYNLRLDQLKSDPVSSLKPHTTSPHSNPRQRILHGHLKPSVSFNKMLTLDNQLLLPLVAVQTAYANPSSTSDTAHRKRSRVYSKSGHLHHDENTAGEASSQG